MNLSLVEYVSKLLKANVLITINIGLLAKVIMIDIHFLSSEIFCYKIYQKEIMCQHCNAANQIKESSISSSSSSKYHLNHLPKLLVR